MQDRSGSVVVEPHKTREKEKGMIIKTRDFGELEFSETDIINFEAPIIGFEECEKYVFLFNDEIGTDIAWLQSVEDEELCFILVTASMAKRNYKVPGALKEKLGDGEYDTWLLMVAADDLRESTVNLRSPVFVNVTRHCAGQIVLEEDLPVSYALFATATTEIKQERQGT